MPDLGGAAPQVAAKAIPALLAMLAADEHSGAPAAGRALALLASSRSEVTEGALVCSGAPIALLGVMVSDNALDETRVAAALAVADLAASDRVSTTRELLRGGAVNTLVALVGTGDACGGEALRAMACLTGGQQGVRNEFVAEGVLPLLLMVLAWGSEETEAHAAWTLANLAADDQHCREALVEAGVLPSLLTILRTPTRPAANRCQAGRAVVNLAAGAPATKRALMDAEVVPALEVCLQVREAAPLAHAGRTGLLTIALTHSHQAGDPSWTQSHRCSTERG